MTILNFIPGGRTAGQIPLRFALENMAKETKMGFVDNEIEMEVIAMAGDDEPPSHSSTTATTMRSSKKSKKKSQDNEEASEDEQLDKNKNKNENENLDQDQDQMVVEMTVPSLVRKKWMDNDMNEHEDNGEDYSKKQTSNEPQSDSDQSDTVYIQFASQHSFTENTFYVQPQFDRIAHIHLPSEVGGAESDKSDEDRPFQRSADHRTMENEDHSEDDEIAI